MSEWPPVPKKEQSDSGLLQVIERQMQQYLAWQQKTQKQQQLMQWVKLGVWVLLLLGIMVSCNKRNFADVGARAPIAGEHIALVRVVDEISLASPANSNDINQAIEQAFAATHAKAVVLYIDSPGGSPVQSDTIWRFIKTQQSLHKNKKVYALVGDVAASGAYYIASAADEIYANRSSLVGSIGVIMPGIGVQGLAQKLGVEDRTMTAGTHKNILSMSEPIDPKEQAHVQAVLDNVHGHFIAAVKAGRGTRLQNNPDIFSGLFWSGEQAKALGLVDQLGGIDELKKKLGVEDVIDYTAAIDPIEKYLSSFGVLLSKTLVSQLTAQINHGKGFNAPLELK